MTKFKFGDSLYFMKEEDYVQKAWTLAQKLHKNQKRKNGDAYFGGHISQVFDLVDGIYANQCNWKNVFWSNQSKGYIGAQVAALLHDGVKDGHISEEELRNKFLSFHVDIIMLLTRKSNETYFDFIRRIVNAQRTAEGFSATVVKLADLTHNMSDLNEGSLRDKYRFAYAMLTDFKELPPY